MKLLSILLCCFFSVVIALRPDPECFRNDTAIKRNFNPDEDCKKWRNGVPYVVSSNLPPNAVKGLECAINEYQTRTCIRFFKRTTQTTYLTVGYNKDVCGVAYGNNVDIGDQCGDGSVAHRCAVLIHELGHTLGYGHEQDRSDRDDWIEIPGAGPPSRNSLTFCMMYDYVSIEHYEGECSIYGGPWKVKKTGVKACGGGYKLSVLDVDKFNACYRCTGCYAYRWMGIQCYDPQKHKLFQGGTDVDMLPLYICRAWHEGDIIPGKAKFPPGERPWCYFGHLGGEHWSYEFEVLTNPSSGGANLRWVFSSDLPRGAIAGGRVTNRTSYYIGRCLQSSGAKNALTPGKVYASDPRKVIVSFGGRENVCTKDVAYLACN